MTATQAATQAAPQAATQAAPLAARADGMAASARRAALNSALLDAHARDDRAALIALYAEAADGVDAADPDAAGFYRTHAYVFALEAGDPRAADLRARLVADGREA